MARVPWKDVLYSLGLFSLCFLGVPVTIHKVDDVEDQFRSFVARHNRSYVRDSAEYDRRFRHFRDSLSRVRSADPTGASFGITKFADFSPEEFSASLRHSLSHPACYRSKSLLAKKAAWKRRKSGVPARVDW